jgi:hypothetical protein
MLVTYEPATGGAPISATARDAALGGLFIESKSPLPVGALLSVEMKSATTSVTLEARVFSVQHDGMAVRFLDLPAGALGKLQAILTHHRPPARTRLGVGDEREALWAAAGGKEDLDPTQSERDDALALATKLEVEGRPTLDLTPQPEIPRHPTPRMVPIAQQVSPAPPPAMPVQQPMFTPSTPPPRTSPAAVIGFVVLILAVLGVVAGVIYMLVTG